MRISWLASFVGFGSALSLAAACGSSSPVHVPLAAGCAINSDCDAPLVCAFQRCHAQCSSSRDCAMDEQCIAAGTTGVCQLADEASCARDSDCSLGQVCAENACRAGCRDDSACLASQRCVAFACQDLPDGGDGADGGDAGSSALCTTATLDADCPSTTCQQAIACSEDGACVYEPLSPTNCGTCGLGTPSCADPANPACDDIELLGVSSAELDCDSTAADSTFLYLAPTFGGTKSDGSAGNPFVTLADALAAATAAGRGPTTIVIAGSPVFEDTLVLPDGVSIRGGYSATDETGAFTGKWRRDLSNRPIWRVLDEHVENGVLIGMRAQNIRSATIVADVTIETNAIRGAGTAEGASNVGILALAADGLRLFDVTVLAGAAQTGAIGAVGAVGQNGPTLQGVNGTVKAYGGAPATLPGNAGAHNSLCDVPASRGGDGGDGVTPVSGHDAPSGAKGDSGKGAANGAAIAAAAATGADGTGSVKISSAGVITPVGDGATGTDGSTGNGGGGGQSAIATASTLYYVDLAGSGAAGGCGGLGGQGGFAGGWSIGMLAVGSTGIVIRGGSFGASAGGDGGAGGKGGKGAPGGAGGTGNSFAGPPALVSTKGGDGSAGQDGGVGGLGAGGSSIGLYCSTATLTIDQKPTLGSGAVGAGGKPVSAATSTGCGLD